MIGYAGFEVFNKREFELWSRATEMVRMIPDDMDHSDRISPAWDRHHYRIRCHELANAVGTYLRLQVTNGNCGSVEHTWCWTTRDHILDVYSIGTLPMVQLVDYASMRKRISLPYTHVYLADPFPRTDIRTNIVNALLELWRTANVSSD